jgi:hypothetical protein
VSDSLPFRFLGVAGGRRLPTSPEARGPTEVLARRKAATDDAVADMRRKIHDWACIRNYGWCRSGSPFARNEGGEWPSMVKGRCRMNGRRDHEERKVPTGGWVE